MALTGAPTAPSGDPVFVLDTDLALLRRGAFSLPAPAQAGDPSLPVGCPALTQGSPLVRKWRAGVGRARRSAWVSRVGVLGVVRPFDSGREVGGCRDDCLWFGSVGWSVARMRLAGSPRILCQSVTRTAALRFRRLDRPSARRRHRAARDRARRLSPVR
jgi:hypothetical protein